MPIDREEFEDASADDLRVEASPTDDEVLGFLADNPDEAYTLSEIQSSVGLPLMELTTRLTQFRQDGAVRHKGSYWTIARGRVRRADGEQSGVE